MTLITPEGESFTELTPAERAYLKALLSKCATRNQLHEKYGIDKDWMRNSPYMPQPLFTWGHGWPMYDAHEVTVEFELSRKRRPNKEWSKAERNQAMQLRAEGASIKHIAIVLDRTPGAVEWKLKHTRRQLRGKAA